MTVPDDYIVPEFDRRQLAKANVNLLETPPEVSLGEAVVYAINFIGDSNRPVRILHGDTLLDGISLGDTDVLAVRREADTYRWAVAEIKEGMVARLESRPAGRSAAGDYAAACGYFALVSGAELVRSITKARGRFIEGLNEYAGRRPLRAMPVADWYDFGHLQTLFQSRRAVSTARAFNRLKIDSTGAYKSASDAKQYPKIRAESEWFRTAPLPIQVFSARLLDAGESATGPYYVTEYEHHPTLAELFVFGAISEASWLRIMRSCAEFIATCATLTRGDPISGTLTALAADKTLARLDQFAEATNFELNRPVRFAGRPLPSLLQIAEDLAGIVRAAAPQPETVMHGDFCFSNILFNFRTRRIRVLDPRGFVVEGKPSLYGDYRYDLAKLNHSVIGRYDQIIAGRYEQTGCDPYRFDIAFEAAPHHVWVESALRDITVGGVRATDTVIQAITTGLFLAMLPLHADRPDRQRAFIANALRLYAGLEVARA